MTSGPSPSTSLHLERAGIQVQGVVEGRVVVRTVLEPTTLDLAERRVGLIGANGSGKSSLLRLFNGLALPSAGRVLVRHDGQDFDTRNRTREVRRLVGFVFTDPGSQLIMPTPIDDVMLSLREHIPDRRQQRVRATELLRGRGLGQVAESSVHELSGGERQLVGLTTVLATEPAIVVADEPTTLLDLRHRLAITRALLDLPQQLVVATHDLELAAQLDRVLVLDRAAVVFDGPADQAISHYRSLMGRP